MVGDTAGKTDQISAHYGAAAPQIELQALEQTLLRGPWEVSVRIAGRVLALEPEWSCVCWHSDGDGDYLELQQRIGDVRIERQVFLSRSAHLAILADVIAGIPAGAGGSTPTIEYCSTVPLADGAKIQTQDKSRECRVTGKDSTLMRVFPLGLPADPAQPASGSLQVTDGRLELRQVVTGTGLYAPLILDWEPERRRAPAEWRPLTITEDRRIVPPERASAFRVKLGKNQLMVYRSLILSPYARALIGYNTRYETVVGWFNTAGEIVPLVQII